jgi:hypothetical protein
MKRNEVQYCCLTRSSTQNGRVQPELLRRVTGFQKCTGHQRIHKKSFFLGYQVHVLFYSSIAAIAIVLISACLAEVRNPPKNKERDRAIAHLERIAKISVQQSAQQSPK